MRRSCALVVLLVSLAAAPAALGSPGSAVLADCNSHGKLTQPYTTAQLRNALATMPATLKEYTNCNDVIQRALLASVSDQHLSDTGASGSGGSFLPAWLVVVLVILVLAAVTLAAVGFRRRRGGPPAAR